MNSLLNKSVIYVHCTCIKNLMNLISIEERILEKSLENHSTIAVKFDRFPFGISLHTDDTLNPLSITS